MRKVKSRIFEITACLRTDGNDVIWAGKLMIRAKERSIARVWFFE